MQTLIKNTKAYRLLRAERQANRFSHAYLVILDDARNLRSALKEFAKLFFDCEDERTEREKIIAKRIDEESFLDCLVYPDPDKKFVVEDAEKLMEECVLKPVESDKRVFLIADFAQANPTSQNKLLKILEEPPENTVFLLGATTPFSVLNTVLSRVAKLEVLPFLESEIAGALYRIYGNAYSETDYALCSATCAGSLGTAQAMLEDGDYKTLIDDAFALCLCTGDKLPSLIKRIGETKHKKELLFLLRVIYRDALLCKSVPTSQRSLMLKAKKDKVEQVAQKYETSALLFAQNELTKAEEQLFFNAYYPQCLEVLLSNILLNNAKQKRKGK